MTKNRNAVPGVGARNGAEKSEQASSKLRSRDCHIQSWSSTPNRAGLGLSLDIAGLAAAIPDATVTGRVSLTFRPPWHRSRLDRSASLRLSRANPAGFVVHSFAGDDSIALRDYVKSCLGLRQGQCVAVTANVLPVADADRTARAVALWREAVDPFGTRVELYLRNRRLRLPHHASEVLRYHPRCPFGPGVRTPCMVALVRSITGDRPIGIQRTALSADGLKNRAHGDSKRILGAARGGAVKLTPDADLTAALGVAEGVENALALAGVPEFGSTAAWAMLGTSGLASLPVLAGIESLWIALDRDPAGEAAALAATQRWAASDREVRHVRPLAALDLNECMGGRA